MLNNQDFLGNQDVWLSFLFFRLLSGNCGLCVSQRGIYRRLIVNRNRDRGNH